MLNVLLEQVLRNRPDLLGIEDVIEKEILHHDIMTVLHKHGFLQKMTFIGGTSLRLCYNSNRLSEDLDFTAGLDFKAEKFAGLGNEIQNHLKKKYGLNVSVREPKLSKTNTSTWKVTIEKFSNRPDLPSQKMHIDVCALLSFEVEHLPIIDHYSISSPMAGLPIPVQSMNEIMADKMIAFAYRERRIKPRDVWDIIWLKQQNIVQDENLILKKLSVRNNTIEDFLQLIEKHAKFLSNDIDIKKDFHDEMGRFLPVDVAKRTVEQVSFWDYLTSAINKEVVTLSQLINSPKDKNKSEFKM